MLIDLSIKLENETPVYPGDPSIKVEQAGTVEADGYALHALTLGTHSGTHIDAPAHMLAGAPTLDALPLDTFTGPGKLIEGLTMEAVQAADLQAGDIALFYTGTSERFGDPTYFTDYPVLSKIVADYLVQRGVKLVGLDTCSADITEDFPIHKLLLGASIPIAENLTSLTALRDKDFRVIALPLRIDADGAPARVVAEVTN